jgi:hypothetical protein
MIRRDTARRLCTAREYELVEASFPDNIRQLTPSKLKQKVERARKLRDKNRDLMKRQRLELRGKRSPRGARPAQGTANTEKKADLFDEVMQRFQDALKPTKKAGAKKTGVNKTGVKKTGVKKTGVKKTGAKKTGAKKTGARKTGAKKAGAKKNSPVASQTTLRQRKDAGTTAFGKTLRARGRAANQRNQKRQDNRGR